jgi:hypothetical protein
MAAPRTTWILILTAFGSSGIPSSRRTPSSHVVRAEVSNAFRTDSCQAEDGSDMARSKKTTGKSQDHRLTREHQTWNALVRSSGVTSSGLRSPILPLMTGRKAVRERHKMGAKQLTLSQKHVSTLLQFPPLRALAQLRQLVLSVSSDTNPTHLQSGWGHTLANPYRHQGDDDRLTNAKRSLWISLNLYPIAC